MKLKHINPLTGSVQACSKKTCQERNGSDPEALKEAFWSDHLDRGLQRLSEAHRSPMVASLVDRVAPPGYSVTDVYGNVRKDLLFPADIMTVMANFLSEYPYETLAVVPAGSLLYNSMLAPAPKDYDFVVFLAPHEDLTGYRRAQIGLVDLFLVPLDLVEHYASRQAQVGEVYLSVKNHAIYRDKKMKLPENLTQVVEELLHERIADHAMKHAEKLYPEDRLDREYKHNSRWRVYLNRKSFSPFDARLSEVERNEFMTLMRSK